MDFYDIVAKVGETIDGAGVIVVIVGANVLGIGIYAAGQRGKISHDRR